MSKYANFIETAENVFKKIYPEIARQMVKVYGKQNGIVVEIGCGSAILSRNLVNLGKFLVYAVDIEPEMISAAKKFIKQENKTATIVPLVGNVESLPFEDNTADFVISRGSMFFWENKTKAFSEIYRILKIGGMTYIGGGFGNKHLKEEAEQEMLKKNPDWHNQNQERLRNARSDVINILSQINVHSYNIIDNESGFWVVILKE